MMAAIGRNMQFSIANKHPSFSHIFIFVFLTEFASPYSLLEAPMSVSWDSPTLNKETLRYHEMSVTIYQSTRRNITEDLNLQLVPFVFARFKRFR